MSTLSVSRSVSRKPNPITGKPPRRPEAALTKRIRIAIEAQIFEGLGRKEAAEKAGIAEITLYQALRKPVVLAYWNEQLKVLRESTRARNIQRLEEIRDQNANLNAAVQAVKVLEPETGRGPSISIGLNVTAGYVMAPPERPQPGEIRQPLIIDHEAQGHNPLTDHDDVGG